MLLSEGVTPVAVADGLDDMIRRLQQIPGGWARPDSWSLVQNSYLQLVETLEQALRSWFEDDDGAVAGLYGEHYKLIREMTASTPRPSPLLNDEAARQVRVLERMKAKRHIDSVPHDSLAEAFHPFRLPAEQTFEDTRASRQQRWTPADVDGQRLPGQPRRRRATPRLGFEAKGPPADAVVTTVVDARGQSWIPRCRSGASGLFRWSAMDSRGPGNSPENRMSAVRCR
jgi:hypothetical protein